MMLVLLANLLLAVLAVGALTLVMSLPLRLLSERRHPRFTSRPLPGDD